jgi:beta-glucanase (GH16 family)
MMKFFFLLLTTLAITYCAGQQKVHQSRKLVWADEFDQPGAPNPSKWDYDLGDGCPDVCGWGNNEAQFYTSDPKNVRVENGHLILEARKEQTGTKEYSSARIISKSKGDWRYGRIAVRAKLPRWRGTWPAIWMLSTEWKYGGWPVSGEIDIMEHVGYDPGVIHGTIHTEKYNHINGTQLEGKVTVADCQENFHVYAVEWTADAIHFFVDDNNYYTVQRKKEDGYHGWPFDQNFHLIMNIAVGGNWGGRQGVDDTIWPQQMIIDYVRVYQ